MVLEIQNSVNPDDHGVAIRNLTKTRDGNVLIEIAKTDNGTKALQEAIATALGDNGKIKNLVPNLSVEIRDLDVGTSVANVEQALKRDRGPLNEVKVYVTKPNSRGQKAAVVQLNMEKAKCRIRETVDVEQCYKCHGYGHRQRDCKDTDRSKLCYRRC